MIDGLEVRDAHVRRAVETARSTPLNDVLAVARDYITLTKPRIISLLLLTTVATMFVADPTGPQEAREFGQRHPVDE